MEPETAVETYNRLLAERAQIDRQIRAIKPLASAEANAKEHARRAERERKKAEALRAGAEPSKPSTSPAGEGRSTSALQEEL